MVFLNIYTDIGIKCQTQAAMERPDTTTTKQSLNQTYTNAKSGTFPGLKVFNLISIGKKIKNIICTKTYSQLDSADLCMLAF